MDNAKKFVIIGKFGAPHGVQGWIRVHSDTDPQAAIIDYKHWYIKRSLHWEPLDRVKAVSQGPTIIAQVNDYKDRDQVKALTGCLIAVTRDQLPELPETEYYWTDLEGLTVINEQNVTLGTVDYLYSNGPHDLMVIKGERERVIPFIFNEFVLSVDLVKGIILVHWDADF